MSLLSQLPHVELPLAGRVAVGHELHGQAHLPVRQVGALSDGATTEAANVPLELGGADRAGDRLDLSRGGRHKES